MPQKNIILINTKKNNKMITEELKARNEMERFFFKKDNIEERVYNYTHFYATGHLVRADIFQNSTGIQPIELEESRWFMTCGEIPSTISNRNQIRGTENIYLFESHDAMIEGILELRGLKRIGNTDRFIYTGENKAHIIGRGGRVIKQLKEFLNININIV